MFTEYFASDAFKNSYKDIDRELATFFLCNFRIDLDHQDISSISFPTFEEVLGLVDLAILRKESFREFEIENRASNSGRLRFIGQYLVFLLARVLDDKLKGHNGIHQKLVRTLHDTGILRDVTFITTNYDILIDNALVKLEKHDVDVDYGIEFRNFGTQNNWRRPRMDKKVSLYKPHGSLNWLLCPTCSELDITPKEKGVVRLISDFANATCPECESVYVPLIVPPIYYKDMSNVFLSSIWNRTDASLRKVDHVIFCGYSFPDADMHIKYLMKRAQTNRKNPLRITVMNYHPGKTESESRSEENRYKRFLGKQVKYTDKSFEWFADNPMDVLGNS